MGPRKEIHPFDDLDGELNREETKILAQPDSRRMVDRDEVGEAGAQFVLLLSVTDVTGGALRIGDGEEEPVERQRRDLSPRPRKNAAGEVPDLQLHPVGGIHDPVAVDDGGILFHEEEYNSVFSLFHHKSIIL